MVVYINVEKLETELKTAFWLLENFGKMKKVNFIIK